MKYWRDQIGYVIVGDVVEHTEVCVFEVDYLFGHFQL